MVAVGTEDVVEDEVVVVGVVEEAEAEGRRPCLDSWTSLSYERDFLITDYTWDMKAGTKQPAKSAARGIFCSRSIGRLW